jgi:hypothetical protein
LTDPLAIIEQLDMTEDCCSSTFPALEACMMNEFILQVREEAVSRGIVVSTAPLSPCSAIFWALPSADNIFGCDRMAP